MEIKENLFELHFLKAIGEMKIRDSWLRIECFFFVQFKYKHFVDKKVNLKLILFTHSLFLEGNFLWKKNWMICAWRFLKYAEKVL